MHLMLLETSNDTSSWMRCHQRSSVLKCESMRLHTLISNLIRWWIWTHEKLARLKPEQSYLYKYWYLSYNDKDYSNFKPASCKYGPGCLSHRKIRQIFVNSPLHSCEFSYLIHSCYTGLFGFICSCTFVTWYLFCSSFFIELYLVLLFICDPLC